MNVNATCRLCDRHSAQSEKVMTSVGQVTVLVCMVCDRAKCGQCGKPLPGRALVCAVCQHPVRMPSPDLP